MIGEVDRGFGKWEWLMRLSRRAIGLGLKINVSKYHQYFSRLLPASELANLLGSQ